MGFDFNIIVSSAPFLLQGLWLNILLTFLATLGGLILGVCLALMRISRFPPLRTIAAAYVDFFRAMPLILVIFWFYLLVPLILGRPVGGFTSVLIAFTIFEAAYFSEIIRGGIQGIRDGQIHAALAIGLTRRQSMFYVILPQVFCSMLPVMLTQSIILFQDTSLVYVVGLYDFVTTSSIVASRVGRLIELYTFVAVVYFILCGLAGGLVDRYAEKHHR
jgi:glutamate/aspartate transport system permease protein